MSVMLKGSCYNNGRFESAEGKYQNGKKRIWYYSVGTETDAKCPPVRTEITARYINFRFVANSFKKTDLICPYMLHIRLF